MKISKFVHSCLLIEENDITILIDPGTFSTQEKALTLDSITKLDYLLITHEHSDHMDIEFIKLLFKKFPHIKIISNKSVGEVLQKGNIASTDQGNDFIAVQNATHEHIFGTNTVVENIMFTVNNKLIHPGDSMRFEKSVEILALPIQAPWGNTTELLEFGLRLRPRVIIAIHDWHWRKEAREGLYERVKDYYAKNGIAFYGVEQGFIIEA